MAQDTEQIQGTQMLPGFYPPSNTSSLLQGPELSSLSCAQGSPPHTCSPGPPGQPAREVLTGHCDIHVLPPLASQVDCVAGVDAGVALGRAAEYQLVVLLVDSAVGG